MSEIGLPNLSDLGIVAVESNSDLYDSIELRRVSGAFNVSIPQAIVVLPEDIPHIVATLTNYLFKIIIKKEEKRKAEDAARNREVRTK